MPSVTIQAALTTVTQHKKARVKAKPKSRMVPILR